MPAAALLTVASMPAPALFSSTAGVLTESRFQASATAPPSPSSSAVRLACGMPTTVTPLAKVTVGVLITVAPSAPGVAEPMLTTVSEPAAPPVPRFTVLVAPRRGRAGADAIGGGPGRGADRRHRTAGLELAGEGLVAVEGLRAGEAGQLGRDVGQREGARRARGDRGQIEDRAPGRVGVVRELEHRVGEEGRQARRAPGAAVPGEEARLVDHPGLPAGPRHQPHPGAVDPVGDVEVPARPGADSTRGDDVAVAVGRARRRRGQVPVEDRELHQPVEQPQRLVDGDVLLRLRRQEIRQQEMRAGVGHGDQNSRVTEAGAPRPTRAESWKMRMASVSPGPSSAPQSATCWAAV